MEKKYEDDELDQLIKEQFLNEAQIMEEALFSDDDTEDYEASDEEIKASYQQLVDRLKAEGVYREDGKDRGDTDRNDSDNCCDNDDDGNEDGNYDDKRDSSVEKRSRSASGRIGNNQSGRIPDVPMTDNTDISNTSMVNKKTTSEMESTVKNSEETDKVIPMYGKRKKVHVHKIGKVAGIIVVSGLCVFAASMTSEANRNYFVRNVKYLTGDRTKIVVGNDENNEDVNVDEYEAKKDIEERLGVAVPEFLYFPKGFKFYSYEIASKVESARIEYIYNGSIISFEIDKQNELTNSRFLGMHGKELETIDIGEKNIHITIKEIKDIQDKLSSYLAQWERNDVIYYISGKIEYDELLKMLQFMEFYS